MFEGLHWTAYCAAIAIYFIPTIAAAHRQHHNTGAILLLNLLLGWTALGWIIALVWAATKIEPTRS